MLPLPLPKRLTESAAEQLSKKQRRRARRAVDEAVLAINWLHGVDPRLRLVHSSNGFAAQGTSELSPMAFDCSHRGPGEFFVRVWRTLLPH